MTLDPEWLRRRYVDDGAPVADIAAGAGVDLSTVHRALRAAGIPPRGQGARSGAVLDRDWLAGRVAAGATPHAIGVEAGVSRSSVMWALAGYGLLDLGDGRALAVRAAELYRSGWSLRRVGEVVGRDRRLVTLYLRALGEPVRRTGRPGAGQGGSGHPDR